MKTEVDVPGHIKNVDFMEIVNVESFKDKQFVAGIDEVAVSPIAGPMISSLVVMPKKHGISQLPVDSKKLNDQQIADLAAKIEKVAYYISFATLEAEHVTIVGTHSTRLNLNKRNAVEFRKWSDALITLDGLEKITGVKKVTSVAQAESKNIAVSAASIVAKHRTNVLMQEYHQMYPYYEFDKNKGYETPAHKKGIKKHGYCPLHRVKSTKITMDPIINLKQEVTSTQWQFFIRELSKVHFLKEELLGEFGYKFFSNVQGLPFRSFTPKMKTCLSKIYFETLRRSKEKGFHMFDATLKMWVFDEQKLFYYEVNRKTAWIISHYAKIQQRLSDKDKALIKKLVKAKNAEKDISDHDIYLFQKICKRFGID